MFAAGKCFIFVDNYIGVKLLNNLDKCRLNFIKKPSRYDLKIIDSFVPLHVCVHVCMCVQVIVHMLMWVDVGCVPPSLSNLFTKVKSLVECRSCRFDWSS